MNKSLVLLIILFTLFTLKPASAATIQLQPGWNMFSIPVNATVDAETIRSRCGTAAKIWNYNASTRNYVDTAQLVPGLGYWIKLNSTCTLSVGDSAVSVGDFPSLKSGWNQIGTASQSIDFSTVRSSTNCNILSGPWLYNSSTNNYNSSNTLNPGVGYWLRVASSCSLGSLLPPPQNCSDGTDYGQCSSVEAYKPDWCDPSVGKLIPNQCGASYHNCPCPDDQSCNETTGSCYTPTGNVPLFLQAWNWFSANSYGPPPNLNKFTYVAVGDAPSTTDPLWGINGWNPDIKQTAPNIKILTSTDLLYLVYPDANSRGYTNWVDTSSSHYIGQYIKAWYANNQVVCNNELAGIYIDNYWADTGDVSVATTQNLQTLGTWLKNNLPAGTLIFANGGGYGAEDDTLEFEMEEGWAGYGTQATWRTWTPQQDIQLFANGLGTATTLVAWSGEDGWAPNHTVNDNQALCQFTFCCYLLATPNPYINPFAWADTFVSPSHGYYPLMTLDPGTPLGPYKQVGNILYRNFTKVNVQVDLNARTGTITPVTTTTCPSLTYPADRWQRVWYTHSTGACLGNGPDQTSTTFDDNWVAGVVAYNQADDIEFHSSRTINFATAGTYTFTLGSDDGARLWIDDVLQIDKWVDRAYTTDSVTLQLKAGNHKFRIDYYENGGNAEVSFSFTLQSQSTPDLRVYQTIANGVTTYYLVNKTGQILTSGSDATAVINAMVANSKPGYNDLIQAGTYASPSTSEQFLISGVSGTAGSPITLTLQTGAVLTIPSNYQNHPVLEISGVSNWIIQGGEVNGNINNNNFNNNDDGMLTNWNSYKGVGVRVYQSSHITIQNMLVDYCRKLGVVFYDDSEYDILNNSNLNYIGWNGVQVGGSSSGKYPLNTTVQNCTMQHAGDVAFDTEGDTNTKFINDAALNQGYDSWGSVNSHWGFGLETSVTTHCSVFNCTTDSSCNVACDLENYGQGSYPVYDSITYNHFAANSADIEDEEGSYCTIEYNTLSGPATNGGVWIKQSNNIISYNSISSCTYGIHLDTSSYSNSGSGNSCDSLPTPVSDQGTGNSVSCGAQSCNNMGLGTPSVSSPAPNQQFQILCPVTQTGDCIYAYANGSSNNCPWSSFTGGYGVFNCAGMPAGTYTVTCKSIAGTNSNCCADTKTSSYTITSSGVGLRVYQSSGINYLQNKAGQVIMSSSDATAVINAAIKAAVSGDTIYIDAGTYVITSSITGSVNGITLTLASNPNAILKATNMLGVVIIHLTGRSNWIIQGGEIDGNGANIKPIYDGEEDGTGIMLDACTNCTIQNLYMHDIRRNGIIFTTGSTGCKVLNSHINDVGANGISMGEDWNSGGLITHDCISQGNLVEHCNEVGIDSGGANNQILNNIIRLPGSTYEGYYTSPHNTGCWQIGLEGRFVSGNLVQGNTVTGVNGIMQGQNQVGRIVNHRIFSNNVQCSLYCIGFLSGDGSTISNNILSGSGTGIILSSTYTASNGDTFGSNYNTGTGNSYDSLPTHVSNQGTGNSVS